MGIKTLLWLVLWDMYYPTGSGVALGEKGPCHGRLVGEGGRGPCHGRSVGGWKHWWAPTNISGGP